MVARKMPRQQQTACNRTDGDRGLGDTELRGPERCVSGREPLEDQYRRETRNDRNRQLTDKRERCINSKNRVVPEEANAIECVPAKGGDGKRPESLIDPQT